jgi:hypothetical protein
MPELPSPLIDILSAESFAAEHLPGSVDIERIPENDHIDD